MLEDIFKMQLELNDYVFKNNNLRNNLGDNLSMQAIMSAVDNKEMMVNNLPNKWALVLSNEAKGLTKDIYKYIDIPLLIPGTKKLDSLNVAEAGSILLNHLYTNKSD